MDEPALLSWPEWLEATRVLLPFELRRGVELLLLPLLLLVLLQRGHSADVVIVVVVLVAICGFLDDDEDVADVPVELQMLMQSWHRAQ